MAKKNVSNKAKAKKIEQNTVTLDFTEAYEELNEMMNTPIIDVPLVSVKQSKPSMFRRLVNWFKKK